MTHNTREVEEIYWSIHTHSDDEVMELRHKAVIARLHQELQKARQTWLREEIVKLEGMKKALRPSVWIGDFELIDWHYEGYNLALQTIIDRYHSELDQLTSNLVSIENTKPTNLPDQPTCDDWNEDMEHSNGLDELDHPTK